MEFEALVRGRRSIRGYKPDPVPREIVEEIIEVAKGAPSSMNTQPWYLHVVTGEPLDKIRKGNTERMLAGIKPERDFPTKEAYEGIHRQRQIEIAVQLFAAMGIARDDKEKRTDWVMRGFRQFDAPVSIVLTYDKILSRPPSASLISARCPMGFAWRHGSEGLARSSMGRALCNRRWCASMRISPMIKISSPVSRWAILMRSFPPTALDPVEPRAKILSPMLASIEGSG